MNDFSAAPARPARGRLAPRVRLFAWAALLYVLAACSNPPNDLTGLRHGAMAKLVVTRPAASAPAVPFTDANGRKHTIAEFKGRVVLLNLWATWCGPCRLEIPSLARLQGQYPARLAVVPVSLDQGADAAAAAVFIAKNPPLRFFSEPTFQLPYAFKPSISDMPTTVIYDRQGRERARLAGGADWAGPDARAIVDALLAEK